MDDTEVLIKRQLAAAIAMYDICNNEVPKNKGEGYYDVKAREIYEQLFPRGSKNQRTIRDVFDHLKKKSFDRRMDAIINEVN